MSASELSVVERLSEALGQLAMRGGYGLGVLASERLAADLLPTVRRIANLRAAEEVRTVRQWLLETGRADADTLQQLRARVDQIAEASA